MRTIGTQIVMLTFFLLAFQGVSQEHHNDTDVAEYLEVNGSMDQYGFAYDQLMQMMEKRYPRTEANAKGWDYLMGNRDRALSEMKALLVPIYKNHFTPGEIVFMLKFFRGPTAQQLIEDRSKMTPAQKEELNSFYNTEIGKKIIGKQSALTEEIGKASETWSHDLYNVAVSLLKDG